MTTKQWLLAEAINSLFDSPPTLNEVGNAMGSSHQNVKQAALKLQQKGLLKLEKDRHLLKKLLSNLVEIENTLFASQKSLLCSVFLNRVTLASFFYLDNIGLRIIKYNSAYYHDHIQHYA